MNATEEENNKNAFCFSIFYEVMSFNLMVFINEYLN
jgi:hypothetical protein